MIVRPRSRAPRPRRVSTRAFTMVELIIVVGIISIIFSSSLGLLARIREHADTSEARLIAQQHGTLLATQWREDIALALDAEIEDDAHAMRIVRSAPDGSDLTIRYELDEKNRILRREVSQSTDPKRKRIVTNVVSLEFERTGADGFRCRWSVEDNNGVRILEWRSEAYAAPLRWTAAPRAQSSETGSETGDTRT